MGGEKGFLPPRLAQTHAHSPTRVHTFIPTLMHTVTHIHARVHLSYLTCVHTRTCARILTHPLHIPTRTRTRTHWGSVLTNMTAAASVLPSLGPVAGPSLQPRKCKAYRKEPITGDHRCYYQQQPSNPCLFTEQFLPVACPTRGLGGQTAGAEWRRKGLTVSLGGMPSPSFLTVPNPKQVHKKNSGKNETTERVRKRQ